MKKIVLTLIIPFVLFGEETAVANATAVVEPEQAVVADVANETVVDDSVIELSNNTAAIVESSNATDMMMQSANETQSNATVVQEIKDFSYSALPTELVERPSYKDVLELYRASKYQEAYDLLLSKYANQFTQEYDYYLAIVALKLSLLDEAYGALDRVLIVDPNNVKAHQAFYNLYLQEKNYAEAKKELIFLEKIAAISKEEVKELTKVVEQKEEETKAEEAAKPKEFRLNTFLGGSIGVGYDSNPLSSAEVLELVPNPLEFFSGTNKQDFTMQSTLYGSLILENLYNTSFGLDTTAMWYKQDYNQNTDLNLNLYSLVTTPTYSYDIYKAYLPIEYQNISMNNALLLNAFGLGVKGDLVIGSTKVDLGIKNTSRTYTSSLSDLDANEFSMGTNLTQMLGESTLRFGLKYSGTSKVGGARTDVNHSKFGLNGSVKAVLLGFNLTTTAKYESSSYGDMSRDDNAWGVSIKSTDTYFKIFTNDTELSYYTNESTNSSYTYYKILLTTSFGFGI